jgi:hypothetical protein
VIRIRIGKQQVELARSQLRRELGLFFFDLLRELRVAGRKLVELDEIARPLFQLFPGSYQLAVLGRLPPEGARIPRVVPDAWLR